MAHHCASFTSSSSSLPRRRTLRTRTTHSHRRRRRRPRQLSTCRTAFALSSARHPTQPPSAPGSRTRSGTTTRRGSSTFTLCMVALSRCPLICAESTSSISEICDGGHTLRTCRGRWRRVCHVLQAAPAAFVRVGPATLMCAVLGSAAHSNFSQQRQRCRALARSRECTSSDLQMAMASTHRATLVVCSSRRKTSQRRIKEQHERRTLYTRRT